MGLVGGLHCVGMCGPIALALPVHHRPWSGRILGAIIYNGGRAVTYAILGAVFGAIGMTFAWAGLQQALSITLGVLLLLTALGIQLSSAQNKLSSGIGRVITPLKTALARRISLKSFPALWITGMLNGLLPCGLVYMAIAGAVATSGITSGALFMMLFGLGTLPAMLGMMLAGSLAGSRMRMHFRKLVPVVIGVMAILLIMRGLNLGIPYISPELTGTTHHHCH